jgi:hypothetical protein
MICLTCGGSHQSLSEKESGDQLAIADLTAQVKRAPKSLKGLIRARRDQLKAEAMAVSSMRRSLSIANQALIDALERAYFTGVSPALLDISREELASFILENGLGVALEGFSNSQSKILESVLSVIRESDPTFKLDRLPSITSIQNRTIKAVFEDVIIPDTNKALRFALNNLVYSDDIGSTIDSLSQQLNRSTGRQLTEVRTQLGIMGRQATADAGEVAGLNLFYYSGPLDGLTRKFCIPLVDKVLSKTQINQLNNKSGLGSALRSGGGYNCRHSFSPVSQGLVQAAEMKRATKADIKEANSGAKK